MKPTSRKRTLAFCILAAAALLSIGRANAQSILYGASGGNNPGNLYTIDPVTGTATLVAALVDAGNNHYAVTGLAFSSVTGVLYGSTSSLSPTGGSELVRINPLSGLVTVIGAFNTGVTGGGGPQTMGDLTFDSANQTLYGSGSTTADLYSISLANGQATLIGPSGISSGNGVGLAANGTGTIYGTPDRAGGELVTYSTSNGATTVVATLSGAPYPGSTGSINALTFNNSSTVLYGVNVDQVTVTRPADVVTIDITTGVVTDLSGASVNFLDAIAFSPVPEPSTWFAGALAIGAIGFTQRRARRPR